MPPFPHPASSAILERDGRYLLVRRRNPPAAEMFAFPGGRGEAGETTAQTAVREFLEETGIAVSDPKLFTTYDLKTTDDAGRLTSHFFLSVFLVEADGDSIAVAADDAMEAGWYTADEIRALPVPPSVLECIEWLAAGGKPE